MKRWAPQIGFVWLPLALAAFYYTAIASDRYVSEAKFILKQTNGEHSVNLDLGSLIGGSSTAHQDALLVQEYILSLDMLKDLDQALHLRQHYSDAQWDPIWRLAADVSQEDFLDYYRRRVRVDFDEVSSILTIQAEAFEPELAQRIAQTIQKRGEAFVNAIGHQMAQEQMAFVSKETNRAYSQLRGAKQHLLRFQDTHDLVSPSGETESRVSIISAMEGDLARERTQLKTLLGFLNPKAQEVIAKRNHIQALDEQIHSEKARLSGREGERLNDLVAKFEDIQMDLEFATDLYRSSLAALEGARVEASRKLKHLIVIESPSLPEEALYPRRLYSMTTLLVFLVLLYGIGRLTAATIKDHKD